MTETVPILGSDGVEPVDLAGDLALDAVGPSRYRGNITRRWWIVIGPNGGLAAALLQRAACIELGRAELYPRSLTAHYLRAPAEGPVELAAVVDRQGRRVAYVSVAMTQNGELIANGRCVFTSDLAGDFDFPYGDMPTVPPPSQCPPSTGSENSIFASRERFERLVALPAVPRSGGAVAGWLRLSPTQPVDVAALALMCDNWPPVARDLVGDDLVHTITLELTVNYRTRHLNVDPEDYCLIVLRPAGTIEGITQEDGELWSSDGRILATSRQIALVFRRDD